MTWLYARLPPFPDPARALRLTLGVITSEASPHTASGLQFGGEEAVRSAALFDQQLDVITLNGTGGAASVTQELLDGGASIVISGFPDADQSEEASKTCSDRGAWLLNAAAPANSLRTGPCGRNVLHVVASDAMRAAARRLAKSDSESDVAMWHPSLERFGAGQLNARYRARFAQDMTGEAWAGWMAMKIAVESFLRVRSTDSKSLVEYATRRDTRFDGHKGFPLSFRQVDYQLRQPLYVIRAGDVITVPSGIPSDPAARDPLDSLLEEARSTCK